MYQSIRTRYLTKDVTHSWLIFKSKEDISDKKNDEIFFFFFLKIFFSLLIIFKRNIMP